MALVEIRELSKSYRRGSERVPVLQALNFDIDAGDFLALMGPSGSGKSTLLNMIAGIDKPDSGAVMIDGVDIVGLSESELAAWRAANIGFIFQFYNLMPVLTAFENVELPLLLHKLPRPRRHERVATALSLVGLADRHDHFPRQLSGGQEQRVAIARAIATDPKLIVADEPTGNLDSQSAHDVLNILRTLSDRAGKTVIMVTHDPKAADRARHILHLDKGVLVEADQLEARVVPIRSEA